MNLQLRQSPETDQMHIRLIALHSHGLKEEGASSFPGEMYLFYIRLFFFFFFLHTIFGENKKWHTRKQVTRRRVGERFRSQLPLRGCPVEPGPTHWVPACFSRPVPAGQPPLNHPSRDSPGSPLGKNPPSNARDPWLGNYDPKCHGERCPSTAIETRGSQKDRPP